MQTMTANEAKTHFGEFIDKAQRRPIGVTRRGRLVGIMMPPEDYEQMRQFYADRLRKTAEQVGKRAEAMGLTEEMLEELLADES
ncbi:MAG TPA: type II toxin-antitoxin system Phd/YefM family antitoxin [Candidatus Thiothrix moscowensis]|uniref:type II toxin-antitoxin system Phd/YefM family antitoxin n=1 Tax=unclassified Thiothrix TaxID=2636184 RepID=UPI0025DA2AEA|nr:MULTISPECIES: type II toxin-antitoxin system Phd/YefM family antitoxin [unclassified Thiothrix]HRJ54481.1 type II toxin-antitoxin system Phd/YefM family antitoxin [Candidatus Thiothrix moscowensis]HRJ94840.1 type II toxin-antitoxin system Phd/YefM family antitoxin [Candidatus Thiothrix moscowensis]